MSSLKGDKHTLVLICEALSPFLYTTMGLYFKDQALFLKQMFIFQAVCLKTLLGLEWPFAAFFMALRSILLICNLAEGS